MLRFVLAVVLLWLSSCSAIFLPAASAQTSSPNANFAITLHSTYTVLANGKTQVEQKFLIKNKSPEVFVSRYGIIVSSTQIDKITVQSQGQTLEPQVAHTQGQTSIGVTFDQPVVGEGKTRELIISYLDADIAVLSGKVLEVNIPALSDPYVYDNYRVELRVPNIFDTPSRINPSNFSLRQEADYNVISYNQLERQAVSAIFGQQQIFDLLLTYQLSNQSNQTALAQIALPPDTPWQSVFYRHLDPPPRDIKADRDGNWIATYEVPANQAFGVELVAQITLQLQANPRFVSPGVQREHLNEQRYFDTRDGNLRRIASELHTVKDIYDYVVNNLSYTSRPLNQALPRLGAAAAISEANRQEATCQEFTDLFVGLARIKEIPARRVVGYAYSSNEELRPSNPNSDILHTWPEYYDPELRRWQPVDPTWENTTGGVDYFNRFDLNHITLAINGVSSTLPHTVGSYKATFAKEAVAGVTPELSLQLVPRRLGYWEVPSSFDLQLHNHSGRAWHIERLELAGEQLQIAHVPQLQEQQLLPFATLSLPVEVYNTSGQLRAASQLQVGVILADGQSFHERVSFYSQPQWQQLDAQLILRLAGAVLLTALIAGSLFLLGRRWAHTLRRQGQKLEQEDHQLQKIADTLRQNQTDDSAGTTGRRPRTRQ